MNCRIRPGHIDFAEMFAVIDKETDHILQTCLSIEAAINAAQTEKEKQGSSESTNIAPVVLDDGGFTDI